MLTLICLGITKYITVQNSLSCTENNHISIMGDITGSNQLIQPCNPIKALK